MKLTKFAVALCYTVALCVGCGDAQKAPAETAIKAASDAYSVVKAEVQKLLPSMGKDIEDTIASAQSLADKKDYAGALTTAQKATGMVSEIGQNLAAKKTYLAQQWATLSASLPPMVAALSSRIDMLTKSKGTPAGVTKDAVEQAKTDSKDASDTWKDAMSAATSGDFSEAVAKANSVKAKVTAAMTALKMKM